jgi:hypothetical protein
LSPDFIENNKGIIQEFIDGVEGSGARLQQALYGDALAGLENVPAEM